MHKTKKILIIGAGTEHSSVEIQMYGHDPSMAPPGKEVIKVELFSRYSYWKELSGLLKRSAGVRDANPGRLNGEGND